MSGPKTLTDREYGQLLKSLECTLGTDKERYNGERNCLMGLLMLDAGLRVGEVARLLIDDLYLNGEARHSLLIREDIAKMDSERIVPLSQRTRNFIAIVNETHWKHLPAPTSGFAFYASTNTEHLTTRQIERIIGGASNKAFGRRINPHVLRHTFASRLMRTVNSRVVQELLGHKCLTSTQIYTHPNHQDLRNAIDSLDTRDDVYKENGRSQNVKVGISNRINPPENTERR